MFYVSECFIVCSCKHVTHSNLINKRNNNDDDDDDDDVDDDGVCSTAGPKRQPFLMKCL